MKIEQTKFIKKRDTTNVCRGYRGFKDKSKYKLYENQDNILVGKGELPFIKGKGWITPCGHLFTNRDDAINYAIKLNQIIADNTLRIKQTKVKYL